MRLGKQRDGWSQVLELIAGIEATTTQKYFLTLVYRHTNWRKGVAWASQNKLAQEMCVSERTAKRIYRWAKRLGVINSTLVRTGKLPADQHNEYSLNIERLKELQRRFQPGSAKRRTSPSIHDSSVPCAANALGTPTTHDCRPELEAHMTSNKGQSTTELGANCAGTGDSDDPIGIKVKQFERNSIKQNHIPHPAFSFELRQVHANQPAEDIEKRENGSSMVISFNQTPTPKLTPNARRIPPVIAYLEKNGRLPPYIPDESQLLFDRHGRYAGYIDHKGSRRNEWNEYESITMAQQRRSHEAIFEVAERSHKAVEEVESTPRALCGEEKLEMLRLGAYDAAQAESWSARSGVPSKIYLTKDPRERAALFRRWKQQCAEGMDNAERGCDEKNEQAI
jgi:hypothetical protein